MKMKMWFLSSLVVLSLAGCLKAEADGKVGASKLKEAAEKSCGERRVMGVAKGMPANGGIEGWSVFCAPIDQYDEPSFGLPLSDKQVAEGVASGEFAAGALVFDD